MKFRLIATYAALFCCATFIHTRVTDTSKSTKNFLFSSFDQETQTMFLASGLSASQTNGEYSLAKSTLLSTGEITVQNMAPQNVILNDVSTELNPIFGSKVTNLELMDGKPALSLDSVGNRVFLVSDVDSGAEILQTDPLTVTDEITATDQIVRLAASSDKIFAVLKPSSGAFGTEKSCICALKSNRSETKLEVYARTGSMHNAAAPDGIQDLMGNVTLTDVPVMHWDSTLNRLFIGLSLSLANVAKVGILVGRFSETSIALTGSIDVSLLTGGQVKIAGENVYDPMSVNYLKTMKTSTGKIYLITQIDADTDTTDVNESAKVFALPLVMENSTAENIGKVSENSGSGIFSQPATSLAQLHDGNSTNKDEAPSLIGGNRPPVTDSADITGIEIVGDAIFLFSKSAVSGEMGIFSSTAIFNSSGHIRGWTSWERAGGIYSPVYGFAMDETSGNQWSIYTSSLAADTVGLNNWSAGNSTGSTNYGFADLTETFEKNMHWSDGGIWAFNIFESGTTGLGNNSWIVTQGFNKVYLVKTGSGTAPKTIPTNTFAGANNIHLFTDEALNFFGELYCSEISRTSASNSGWLFLGTQNGLVVLSKTDGTGWDSSVGLSDCNTGGGGDLENCTFKNLSGISEPVYSLRSDGTNLFVTTNKKLYKVVMGASHFGGTDTDISSVTTQEFSCASDEAMVDLKVLGGYNDGTLKPAHAILVTTKRLYFKANIHNAGSWTEITLPSTENIISVTLKAVNPKATIKNSFAPVGSADTIANLYVLMGCMVSDSAKIYRLDVQGVVHADATPANRYFESITAVEQIDTTDAMIDLQQFRAGIFLRGVGYSFTPTHLGRSDLLRNFKFSDDALIMENSHAQTDVTWSAQSPYYFSNLVQSNASGNIIAAGSWGIRVNE
ncbi:hypothetical protein ACFLY6_02115 [Candidatus Dependentiae bacterium]